MLNPIYRLRFCLATLLCLSMTSCSVSMDDEVLFDSSDIISTESDTQSTSGTATEEITEEITENATVNHELTNPLTGEGNYNPDAVGKRPIAVMVNNITASLPQYGVAAADIIYEMEVEGGITRLMACYADYTNVPNVCSIRSCRYYYPLVAMGMDAIYLHWGADQSIAAETLQRTGIDHIDGGGNGWQVVFFRDQSRVGVYSQEHTGYLKGDALPNAIENSFGMRTETDYGSAFQFNKENLAPQGQSCSTANLPYSGGYYSTFTYDAENKVYLKQHSGKAHMDSATGTQLAFTNVFALSTPVSLREDQYHMDVGLKGGSGYYISYGVAEPITWRKDGESLPIRVFDSEGNEITVNTGKSYIGLISDSKTISIS